MNIHEKINARSWMTPKLGYRFIQLRRELWFDENYAYKYGIDQAPYCASLESRCFNKKVYFNCKF